MHSFERTKGLRDGPAPLPLVSLGPNRLASSSSDLPTVPSACGVATEREQTDEPLTSRATMTEQNLTLVTYSDPESGQEVTVRLRGEPIWDGDTLRVGDFFARKGFVRLVVPGDAERVKPEE